MCLKHIAHKHTWFHLQTSHIIFFDRLISAFNSKILDNGLWISEAQIKSKNIR